MMHLLFPFRKGSTLNSNVFIFIFYNIFQKTKLSGKFHGQKIYYIFCAFNIYSFFINYIPVNYPLCPTCRNTLAHVQA